jgi:Holliday junction resolvase-like predicted endonuclease
MDENEIVEAVCDYLQKKGYEISKKLHTTEHGIDIVAKNRISNEVIHIEAKGGTSSRIGSRRFGKPYTSSQVFDRVAKGFYTACQMLSQNENANNKFVLAVPDTILFRKYLNSVKPAMSKLGIGALLVSQTREISEF